jgi:hypothetical protein
MAELYFKQGRDRFAHAYLLEALEMWNLMAVNIKVKHLKERYPGVLSGTMLAHTEDPERETPNPEGSAQGSRNSRNSGLTTNYISHLSGEHSPSTPSATSSSERGTFFFDKAHTENM